MVMSTSGGTSPTLGAPSSFSDLLEAENFGGVALDLLPPVSGSPEPETKEEDLGVDGRGS